MSKSSSDRAAAYKHSRVIVIVVPPVDELDLIGPLQVFTSANRLTGQSIYSIEVVTNAKALKMQGEGGAITFLAQGHFGKVRGKFDSVLLVCGLASRTTRDEALFAWLRKAARAVRRIGAVCVGAFLLAEAGLLDGKKATAHWKFGRELEKRYPKLKVQSDPLWVRDGNIYTSAGISAGIDLALAWVEEDCSSAVAHEAARELVLYLRRPSGQKQLSVSLTSQASEMKSIQQLAEQASMSVRNFERVFTREVGRTPSQYVMHVRVETARRQLERTDRGLKQIALATGFGSVEVMRRGFIRLLGVTPRHYRQQLNKEITVPH